MPSANEYCITCSRQWFFQINPLNFSLTSGKRMPVAVRLIEVLAIIALVATMAAGTAIVIFMEKCLALVLMITAPLVYTLSFFLGLLKYVFLKLMYKLTYLMQNLAGALWDTSQAAGKCSSF